MAEVPVASGRGVVVVLASASPRRRGLLGRLGVVPEVRPVALDETPREGEAGPELARRLAEAKCAAAEAGAEELVIAADTVVELDGRPLGKPADEADARAMLRTLAGHQHAVTTGVAARLGTEARSVTVTTLVTFRDLTDREISDYVATGEPMDKAGAYAIQGRGGAFVSSITGSDTNVVGLPLADTVELTRGLGVDLLAPRSPASGHGGA